VYQGLNGGAELENVGIENDGTDSRSWKMTEHHSPGKKMILSQRVLDWSCHIFQPTPHHVVHFSILHFPQFHLESKALAHDAKTTYFSHSEWIVVTARSNSDTAVRVPSQFRWLVLRTSIHTDATNTAYHDTDLQNYSRTAIVFSSLTMLVSSQAVKHQSAHQYVFQSHSSNIFHYN